jgi:serine/threonine protein kinase
MRDVASGLQAAHAAGLLHRDVKPGNLLFSKDGIAKIVDFGLPARLDTGEIAQEIWGTAYYVAPEKIERVPEDVRSDIYSLGATMFHMVSGRPPFNADDPVELAMKHVTGQAPALQTYAPSISSSTASVINRCLARHPEDRFQDYEELIQFIDIAIARLSSSTDQPKISEALAAEAARAQKAKARATMILGAVALLLIAALTVFFTVGPRGNKPTAEPAVADNALSSNPASHPKIAEEADDTPLDS